jgi:DNA-binding NarL/FixJ family response regulator
MRARRRTGWLFLPPEAVPPRWRDRAVDVRLVPLLPDEADRLLTDEPLLTDVDPEDERLLMLVARGLSAPSIARELGSAVRTVERRLSRLRERFGVETTAELVALLAREGFSK